MTELLQPNPLDAAELIRSDSRYAPEREVRLAIVMYGGVSLAIYMYGVAQELLNLVKATAPAVPGSSKPGELAFRDDDDSTISVYRKLARLMKVSPDDPDPDGPVRVRFVVDLISGSSAGGLNGVCLATALANDRPDRDTSIEPLEKLWLEQGDLDKLLADEQVSTRRDRRDQPQSQDVGLAALAA